MPHELLQAYASCLLLEFFLHELHSLLLRHGFLSGHRSASARLGRGGCRRLQADRFVAYRVRVGTRHLVVSLTLHVDVVRGQNPSLHLGLLLQGRHWRLSLVNRASSLVENLRSCVVLRGRLSVLVNACVQEIKVRLCWSVRDFKDFRCKG